MFPILNKLFGSQKAGEAWIKERMREGSKLYSVYKTHGKIGGSIRILLLTEAARRGGFILEEQDFKLQ